MPVHTTIPGTWLLFELARRIESTPGAIAEVGAYQGGNALGVLGLRAALSPKPYYVFDSFEGFPELSAFDPATMRKGDYRPSVSYQEVLNHFAPYPEARVIKGFVPGTFRQVPDAERFALVFYDCDLYQPTLDTCAFFWDRLSPGGFLVIHDYHAEEGGFAGVKKATDEFFAGRHAVVSFYESTMAVVRK